MPIGLGAQSSLRHLTPDFAKPWVLPRASRASEGCSERHVGLGPSRAAGALGGAGSLRQPGPAEAAGVVQRPLGNGATSRVATCEAQAREMRGCEVVLSALLVLILRLLRFCSCSLPPLADHFVRGLWALATAGIHQTDFFDKAKEPSNAIAPSNRSVAVDLVSRTS